MANSLQHFRQFSTRTLKKTLKSKQHYRGKHEAPSGKLMRTMAYGLLVERGWKK